MAANPQLTMTIDEAALRSIVADYVTSQGYDITGKISVNVGIRVGERNEGDRPEFQSVTVPIIKSPLHTGRGGR